MNKLGNIGIFNVDFFLDIIEKIKEIIKDVDFNVNWKFYIVEKDLSKLINFKLKINYGILDKFIVISEVFCGGCGVLLYC